MPRNGYWREFSLHFSHRSMNSWSEPELPRYMLLSSVILESRCRLWWAKPRLNRDSLIIWLMNLERFELFPFFASMSTHIKLLDNTLLSYIYSFCFFLLQVQREFHLPLGDFPNVEEFKEVLSGYSFDRFERLKPKMIQAVDDMLGYDIPNLLKNFGNPYD